MMYFHIHNNYLQYSIWIVLTVYSRDEEKDKLSVIILCDAYKKQERGTAASLNIIYGLLNCRQFHANLRWIELLAPLA